ncbi:O-antigen ligase family protein [Pokkaliibacter sp. CJK22405]|uniref:O-antigen ligase family protein n=1 Tax=Pokkaliibacter sp. CJK22405 TaxID=3384615 RepID=UPI003984FEC7
MDQKVRLRDHHYLQEMSLTSILIFISVTLLGADKLNLSFGNAGIKLSLIPLALLFAILILNKSISYSKKEISYFSLLILGALISFYNTSNIPISIGYVLWMCINYGIIYTSFRCSCLLFRPEKLINIYIYSFRLQIFLSLLLYPILSTEDGRISLFYYEPSYFSMAAIPYISFSLYKIFDQNIKTSKIDLFLILSLLFLTKSANLILIILSTLSIFFISTKKISFVQKIFSFIAITVALSVFYLIINNLNPHNLISYTLNNILNSDSKLDAILDRTGNRWPRLLLALQVSIDHFFIGVGPGNYRNYTDTFGSIYSISDIPAIFSPIGLPAVNIWLEVLAENGILGLIGFSCIILITFKNIRKTPPHLATPLSCALLVFMISLFFESSYLRLYFWAFLGLANGIFLNVIRTQE